MNIGIITYHRAENYGSVLQAYALNKYIKNINSKFHVETIDYYNETQEKMYNLFQSNSSIMNIIRNIHTLLNIKALKNKKKAFKKFISIHISLSETIGNDTNKLKQYAQKYDICICGSDQIWNIHCDDQDINYFLSFSTNSRKVAYAPSLGINQFSEEENKIFKKYISNFDALSVREDIGAKYLENIIQRPIEVVAAPVFLLKKEEWQNIAANPIKEKYILCYFIGDTPGLRDFAQKVQKESGYKAIVILKNLRDIKYGFTSYYEGGPSEFIGLIKNAEYIITTSFHAVAFSLIFHKLFWVFTGSSSKPNSRITNICGIVGLKSRILDSNNWKSCKYNETINYTPVDEKIEKYRQHSINYLKKACTLKQYND